LVWNSSPACPLQLTRGHLRDASKTPASRRGRPKDRRCLIDSSFNKKDGEEGRFTLVVGVWTLMWLFLFPYSDYCLVESVSAIWLGATYTKIMMKERMLKSFDEYNNHHMYCIFYVLVSLYDLHQTPSDSNLYGFDVLRDSKKSVC